MRTVGNQESEGHFSPSAIDQRINSFLNPTTQPVELRAESLAPHPGATKVASTEKPYAGKNTPGVIKPKPAQSTAIALEKETITPPQKTIKSPQKVVSPKPKVNSKKASTPPEKLLSGQALRGSLFEKIPGLFGLSEPKLVPLVEAIQTWGAEAGLHMNSSQPQSIAPALRTKLHEAANSSPDSIQTSYLLSQPFLNGSMKDFKAIGEQVIKQLLQRFG